MGKTVVRITMLASAAGLTGAAVVAGTFNAQAQTRGNALPVSATGEWHAPASAAIIQPIGGGTGPDLICGSINQVSSFGQNTDGTIVAYSLGEVSCNIGTQPVAQVQGFPQHAMSGENVFRLHNGRFEQIGQKWIFHGVCALQQSLCSTCSPFCAGCCDHLGVGCSNPSVAALTGSISLLGPKSSINPSNGFTLGTFAQPVPAAGDVSGNIVGRLQIHKSDLYNVNFPGARFFGEVQHVAADDASAGNDNNNASWRELAFDQPATPPAFPSHIFTGSLLSTGSGAVAGTNREESALFAWQEFDVDPNNIVPVTLVNVDVPADGRFILGYKVVDNHNGTYTYEYAVHNLNSDRSTRALTIPLGTGASATNIGFHDVDYHSANGTTVPIYSGADWTSVVQPASISWFTDTFAVSVNANAIRWGTLYNFRFTSSAAPIPVNATLNLFKPGSPANIVIATVGPGNGTSIPADLNHDGIVNTLDLGILLSGWTIPPATSCAPPCTADINHDGVVNTLDLGIVLSSWTL